jgi:hypothetical protein
MTTVPPGAPTAVSPFDRLLEAIKENPKTAAGIIAGILLVIGLVVWFYWPNSASVRTAKPLTPTQQTQTSTTVNPDATALFDQAVKLLSIALEQNKKERVEDRRMIDVHTDEIKGVKASTQTDPKLLEMLRNDIEALKKLNATPAPALKPMSALEEVKKTA